MKRICGGCQNLIEQGACPHCTKRHDRRRYRNHGAAFARAKRREAKRRAHRCERCGWRPGPASVKRRLEWHHRDGNRDNNEGANLALLCTDCHLAVEGKVRHGG